MKYCKGLFMVFSMAVFVFLSSFTMIADCQSTDIFWFVFISDSHIGKKWDIAVKTGDRDEKNLGWIVNEAYDVINPALIINSGDLVNCGANLSSSGNGPYQAEWDTYKNILSVISSSVYYDAPGNHDQYNESNPLTLYLNNSVQGPFVDPNTYQHSWLLDRQGYGQYHFMTIATPDPNITNPMTDFSNRCIGGLSNTELEFIENKLISNQNAVMSFIFGHHALTQDWGLIDEGLDEFIKKLKDYDVSFYGYGHTHKDHYIKPYYIDKTLVYNVESLYDNSKYAIVAVDNNGISVTEAEVEKWPVVLITEPLDRKLGADDKLKTYNPFACSIFPKKDVPIRALVFSKDPVHADDVEFRYRKDKWTAIRFSSIPDVTRDFSLNNGNSYLWTANWDTSKLKPGNYLVRVDAKDSFDEIAVRIKSFLSVVLVIDCSGSMGGYTYPTKMDSAKLSAKIFINSMSENDKVGVVKFSSVAYDVYLLTRITGDNIKTEAESAIDNLYAGGGTSIGAGLQTGQKQFTDYGADDPARVMILLSDGKDGDSSKTKDVLLTIVGTQTKIYAIGLGEGADESLLNTIALSTGGVYYFAPSDENLTAIYQSIQSDASGLQTIAEKSENILQDATSIFTVGIDPGLVIAIFQASIEGSDIDLVLVDPNGSEINPAVAAADPSITYISGTAFRSYKVSSPMPGNWTMKVFGKEVAPGGEQINVRASGETDITLTTEFDKIEYVPGGSINVIAGLEDAQGVILGATVTADIQTPLGDSNMVLYDDGAHGDKGANDGIYGNFFTDTSQQGNYTFKVDAAGTSNEGNPFTRTATKTTVVGQDTDGDGMADTWEGVYGLNPNLDDSTGDPDGDGLTNLQEYSHRTNPQNADTDNDGCNDKEEIDLGSDPLDFDDVPVLVTAVCKDISIQLDEFGSASITAGQVDGGSTADNGINTMSVSPSSFSSNDIGNNSVTLTVTDMQGNSDVCLAMVSVTAYPSSDPNEPDVPALVTAVCKDISIQLDEHYYASISASDVDGGSTADNGIDTMSVSPSSFSSNDIGNNYVTLTVTDFQGNSDQCDAIVTVNAYPSGDDDDICFISFISAISAR